MGALAGHMSHLYDNPNLTFKKMKEILAAASEGKLEAEEKVDGQNLYLSYSLRDAELIGVPDEGGKAKGARNKGNLRAGGLDAVGLAQKFADRGNLEKTFVDGFATFEQAVEALGDEEKLKIFGPNTDIWYNAEVMDPGSRNVINYDSKILKIHDRGHFKFDIKTGEKTDEDVSANLAVLDSNLKQMQNAISDKEFSLARSAIIQLQKLEDDSILKIAYAKLDAVLRAAGVSENDRVGNYVFNRIISGLDAGFSEEINKDIAKYLLKLPDNIGLLALKKKLKPEEKEEVNNIVASKQLILKQAIEPIELIIHNFSVEVLKSLKSVYIADTDKEVARLRQELSDAVNDITATGEEDPESMNVLQFHLNKIGDMSKITTPTEGIVFDYDGHMYKFTGNFAPLNQILGLFKYGKKGQKLTTEGLATRGRVITEKEGKRIALIPGGFKPPHAGHFMLAKHFANKSDVDEVRVIVSTKPRPPVTVNMAIKLWELYTKNFPKIKVQAGTTASPVGDVYELVADNSVFKEGDVALLGKSEKDVDDTRFDRAQSYAERHNPGVTVEPVVTPLFAGGVSGTQMRNLLAQGEEGKNEFKANLPRHLNAEEREAAYNIVTNATETLDNFIDSTIEEMSAMAGGAVEGTPGGFGFGPPNRYNPYRKTKKPKVKRGKRQRRR